MSTTATDLREALEQAEEYDLNICVYTVEYESPEGDREQFTAQIPENVEDKSTVARLRALDRVNLENDDIIDVTKTDEISLEAATLEETHQ